MDCRPWVPPERTMMMSSDAVFTFQHNNEKLSYYDASTKEFVTNLVKLILPSTQTTVRPLLSSHPLEIARYGGRLIGGDRLLEV